jgi:hypothetical protein
LEGREVLYRVTIVLKSGAIKDLLATEFDVNLDPRQPVTIEAPHEYLYKDANGEEASIYLTLKEVAAITVEPAPVNVGSDLVDPSPDL